MGNLDINSKFSKNVKEITFKKCFLMKACPYRYFNLYIYTNISIFVYFELEHIPYANKTY